ncbi:hypothetical protein HYS00_03530 [Candidatus Microgenomates bacterium]|nr:hypothetical protein [Candidatus Microgenomates bacterium]
MNNSFRKKFGVAVCLVSVLMLTLIVNIGAPKTYAGNFSPRKVTISDSRASGTSVSYAYAFTTTATTSIKQIDFKFCTQAGAWADTCTAPTGLDTTGASRSADNLAGTGRTDSSPAANTWRTVVTTPSTQSTQAVTYTIAGMTNPSTTNTTFYARIITWSDTGSTEIDSGTAAFAILTTTSIAVSATVLENFTFTVAGVNSGGTVNGATTNITTTASTIPFGTLTAATPKIGAHDVTVTTNAGSGYSVTTKGTTSPLLVSGSQNIDEFSGSYASPATWSSPAGTAASVNTGYFGYTTEDTDISAFQSNKWAGGETTARSIVSSSVGVSAETTRIGWQAEINAVQPAGTYSGTEILVATPTY